MNQYDTTPLNKQQSAWLKACVFGIVIAVAVVVLLALGGCSEKDPPPSVEDQLQGAWVRKWIGIENTYSFDGHGQCIKHAIIPGQPVQAYFCKYWLNKDTLYMVDLASASAFRDTSRAVVEFPTDSTAVLGWIVGVNYFLTRI